MHCQKQQENGVGCLGAAAVAAGFLGVLLAFYGGIWLGLGFAVVFWLLCAIPVTLVWFVAGLVKQKPAYPPPYRPKPAPIPTEPSKAQKLAEAKARYQGALAMIDAAGLNPAEARSAKEKARRQLMTALDALL